jgi:hypothetical protein
MPNWIISVYHPLSQTSMEFDMESDTKPIDQDILQELEFFVEFDEPINS